MKYMVMEVFDSYAVVLDRQGRFIKTANLHYTPGQTVTDIVPMQEEAKNSAKQIPWKKVLAMAACFAFMATAVFSYISTPYASVFISINPSVRIDIDKNENVKKITGTNTDGKNLLLEYDYTGKTLDTAMDDLVDLAINRGYLYDGGRITVTLEGESRWVQNNETVVGEHINRHMQEKLAVTIQVGEKYTSNTQITVPSTDYGETDYGYMDPDTDYGEHSDGVTDYDTPDTDYSRTTDYEADTHYSQSDHRDGETDYGLSDYN